MVVFRAKLYLLSTINVSFQFNLHLLLLIRIGPYHRDSNT